MAGNVRKGTWGLCSIGQNGLSVLDHDSRQHIGSGSGQFICGL